MRAEHWYDFGTLTGDSNLFVQVVAHIAAAAVPLSVLQYLKVGQITPLAKPTGGHRPLFMVFLSPQTCSQISHGSQKGISGQTCWTFAVWCWTTRWSKHNDQNHSIPRGG